MNEATREKLMGVAVATLATALYKRGLRSQVMKQIQIVRIYTHRSNTSASADATALIDASR